ncbi:MAG: phage BR0599 family protein, partial [Sphingomicrobium sp.]
LRTAPSSAVAIGTPLEIIEGCDKRLETCSARFANAANFRGEPHLPGNDLLTRYPGA